MRINPFQPFGRVSRLLPVALLASGLSITEPVQAQGTSKPSALALEIDKRLPQLMPKVIGWRRDIHEHPELSGEETRTAKLVADHLRALGIEVRTGVGGHGVVGVLKGGKPGPVVALRSDLDALPVEELVDLPFKSKVKGTYRGQAVGVMHACGHDMHIAMLMGAAEILAGLKAQLPGTVKLIFQPAEEGLPNGGTGAKLMLADGVLENPKVDVIFGMHVGNAPLGTINYRPGPAMAASNSFSIVVHGKQAHGAMPWAGVDPIVVGSQIVAGLQTIISRQTDISSVPAILTVGAFQGGVRNNIIPDSVVMLGTIRTFDLGIRQDVFARVARTAESIAAGAGGKAIVKIDSGNLVTRNDSALTQHMVPTLQRAAGPAGAQVAALWTASEDFSWYQDKIPGLFFNLGITPRDKDWRTAPSNHSPLFFADEAALPTGVRVMASVAVDYLLNPLKSK
ncbi:MAG: amidohydrolase [Gemmatimonadaceae bacterium]|nr:amidohydrolase [Gemmatimonadaceae bacterium]